ncbi:hypothetical protein ACJX0J_012968 [Zea mays]
MEALEKSIQMIGEKTNNHRQKNQANNDSLYKFWSWLCKDIFGTGSLQRGTWLNELAHASYALSAGVTRTAVESGMKMIIMGTMAAWLFDTAAATRTSDRSTLITTLLQRIENTKYYILIYQYRTNACKLNN